MREHVPWFIIEIFFVGTDEFFLQRLQRGNRTTYYDQGCCDLLDPHRDCAYSYNCKAAQDAVMK